MSSEHAIAARVEALLASASSSVRIIAPFMKRSAVARLLERIPAHVTDVVCLTRWLPEDVKAGVSDLDVLDVVSSRLGARLLVHSRLHAKLYRADERRLVGSVNVTARALGWCTAPNIEILATPSLDEDAALQRFEATLVAHSIVATEELQRSIQAAVDVLQVEGPQVPYSDIDSSIWIPECARPDKLWSIYADDDDAWQVVGSAGRAGRNDIEAMRIPPGLPRSLFEQFIRFAFVTSTAAVALDQLAEKGFDSNEGVRVLQALRPDIDASYLTARLEVVLRWMEFFSDGNYQRVPMGEVFRKGRILP